MRILFAGDEKVTRLRIKKTLAEWGFATEFYSDGEAAMKRLCEPDPPRLCILEWLLPGLEGPELCRRIRQRFPDQSFYFILLTARQGVANISEGLNAGADDYMTKPFSPRELRSRIQVGLRIIGLECALAGKIKQLTSALDDVRQLRGLLPICSYCTKIRNDQDYWEQVESYISRHSGVAFSHSVCPECYEKYVKPMLEQHGKALKP